MLTKEEIRKAVDDVLGNTKDPLRLTKDYLKQVDEEKKRIDRLKKKLLESRKESKESDADMHEVVDNWRRLLKLAREDYCRAVERETAVINTLQDERQKKVLKLRYVDCVSDWKRIAKVIGTSQAKAHEIHTAGLYEVKKVVDKIRYQ